MCVYTHCRSSDLEILVHMVKFIRSIVEVEPWKSSGAKEAHPGPECTSDDDIKRRCTLWRRSVRFLIHIL